MWPGRTRRHYRASAFHDDQIDAMGDSTHHRYDVIQDGVILFPGPPAFPFTTDDASFFIFPKSVHGHRGSPDEVF
jgi:hypothetical protein